mgnify:CR=1 FL=1
MERTQTQMLTAEGEELPYVSLADFKRLKTLRCSTSLLTGDPDFPKSNDPLASGEELVASASDEYKEAIEYSENDDFLKPSPGTLRRLAFATRLPQSLQALHLERYPCHTPLAYHALSEFVQKADGLLPHLKQLFLSDWSIEHLKKKGFLDIVKQSGLRYKKLPDPFRARCTPESSHESYFDSSSDFEDDPNEEGESNMKQGFGTAESLC